MVFEDKPLVCADCGSEFTFTAGEQEFYESRGLMNEPRRCPECRQARKRARTGQREMHKAICAACGAECEVPFLPKGDRPVYCNECYSTVRDQP